MLCCVMLCYVMPKQGLSCQSIHAVRMRCGSGSGDGKNREHRKYKCQNPFTRYGSGTACDGVADPPPPPQHHGVICAAAARPPQRKVGVVCLPAIFFSLNFWTPINSFRSFQESTTVMKDNYEKLNSSCMRLR